MTTKVTSSDHCGSPDELRKWVDKDRMGTHWVGCEKSHKDCAILKAADAWDLALVARYAIEEKYRALVKRLEAAESVRHAAQAYLNWHRRSFADPSCAADILNEELEGDRLGDALVAAFAGKETK